MAEETAGDEEDDAGDSAERRVHQPEPGRGHFFQEASDPAHEIIRPKEGEIIDADDGGGQGRRRDARVERERDGKDVGESDAVEKMKGDEPADRNAPSGSCGNRRTHGERKEPGHSDEAADTEFGNLRRLRKFFRPESPEHDRARETADG